MLEFDAKLKLHSTNPCEYSPAARYTHVWRSGIPIATKAKGTTPKTIYIYYISMFYGYHHGSHMYILTFADQGSDADQIGPITFSHAGIESLTWHLSWKIESTNTCWMVMLCWYAPVTTFSILKQNHTFPHTGMSIQVCKDQDGLFLKATCVSDGQPSYVHNFANVI